MYSALTLLRAMNGIHEEDVIMAGKIYYQQKKRGNARKIIQLTLLAAVLVSLLSVAAYASGFLGSRAIVIPETAAEPVAASAAPASPKVQEGAAEENSAAPAETAPQIALVSLTQPQAVPEELDGAVREKVENARAAWDEWQSWRKENLPQMPEVFSPVEGAAIVNYVDNGDGSATVSYYGKDALELMQPGTDGGEPDFSAATPIEVRTATAEEMAQREKWLEYAGLSYGDYDFNYDIHTAEEAARLEEIAAKYGLSLRKRSTLLWSRETVEESDAEMNAKYGTDLHTDTSDPRFLSNRELCERVSENACHGSLFREIPRGFDKVYYFDEGSFCVSYDQELSDGRRLRCYGYNSMYATLSSGREVVTQIEDPESFPVRTHTAPDGTELTILQKDNEAFLYVYLPDSFFEMHIWSENALSDADVDAAADNLNYSNIGK